MHRRDKTRLDRFADEVGADEMLLTLPGDAAEEAAVRGAAIRI
ncbi:MAG: hypothetical protein ACRDRK_25870 [Pseudonocardia sp.]